MRALTVKTLLGHKNLQLSIGCLTSFIENSGDPILLKIFEDGSLEESDRDSLKSAFSNIVIISKKERDDKLKRLLQNHPHCNLFRNNSPYAQKLFDVILYDNEDNEDLLFIDSDVYFIKKFKLPKFNQIPVFMLDTEHAFSFTPIEFLAIRTPIYPLVNTGLFYFPKSLFSLDYVEKLLENKIINKGFERRSSWLEQTLWAFLAAKGQEVNYFDKNEIVMAEKELEIDENTIAIHLVSTYRHHFSTLKNNTIEKESSGNFKEIRLQKGGKFLNKFEFALQKLLKRAKRELAIK